MSKLAVALSVPSDALLFDDGERGPSDDLLFQFEAIRQLPPDQQQVVRELLNAMVLKQTVKRWADDS